MSGHDDGLGAGGDTDPRRRRRALLLQAVVGVASLAAAAAVLLLGLNLRDEDRDGSVQPAFAGASGAAERGAYLARAGNCMGCHTAPGGAQMAGGRRVETPFGSVYAPNLTPDDDTGLGRWTEADFWRALHNGRSRDGHLLAPAFPYPNYTQVTREDAGALFAYLRALPPVRRPAEPHGLRWPYGTQPALAVWRALYFRPGVFEADPARDASWNRGAYLVRGLGHCEACHTSRNALGGSAGQGEFSGGMVPMQRWYAPALASGSPAGTGADPRTGGGADDAGQVAALLRDGVSSHGAVIGPMADVVATSTQHLTDADIAAMAGFLRTLPPLPAATETIEPAAPSVLRMGGALYHDHCERCHGDMGQGAAGAYPPLAGNRSVLLASPVNVVQAIIAGGYPPSTPGNPRPYGMPPFAATLDEGQVAAVATYIRQSFGNRAPAVSAVDVARSR